MNILNLAHTLWPIPRSITGEGVRETLRILSQIVPLNIMEFNSGLKCLDWTIPKEWRVKKAYIKTVDGEIIVDFHKNNLYLLGYSIPFFGYLSKAELLKNVYTLEAMPTAIPYRTSYYAERWGFCMEYDRLSSLKDTIYEVCIDTELFDGSLTLADAYIQGKTNQEILFSTYVCHPMMGNNELSGPIVQTMLYKWLLKQPQPYYSYRFIYIPETIGSIVYLHHFGETLKNNVCAGYVITCVGDNNAFTYKKSRLGNSLADKVALYVLKAYKHTVYEWFPTGSDERQYCSPKFNLPIGSLMRSMYGTYPEYHTSLDNLDFISEEGLEGSFDLYKDIVSALEKNKKYINISPGGEPQLGPRHLYHSLSGSTTVEESVQAYLWILAYSDGQHDLIDIASKSNLSLDVLDIACHKLIEADLLQLL